MSASDHFRDLPILGKLRVLILSFSLLSLLLVGATFFCFADTWSHADTRHDLVTLARLLELSVADPLARNQPAVTQLALDALKENPNLAAGAVLRPGSGIFAQFGLENARSPLPQPLPAEGFHAERLELVKTVRSAQGVLLGTIYLRADLARQRAFEWNWLGLALLGVLAATLLTLAFATRIEQLIVGPAQGLARAAELLRREENFTIRAPASGLDELGQMVNAFNELLAHLQLRDTELRRHRDHLGDLVAQRTAELMEMNHALAEAQTLAADAGHAKRSFLTNMSHELRTPLNAIIGYSDMLIEESGKLTEPEALADLQRINTAGRHLLTLINGVLDLSKIEAGKLILDCEEFDLVALARGLVDTVRPLALKNENQLELEVPGTSLKVHGDSLKIGRALLNLLNNACKFTTKGVVKLRLTEEEVEGRPWVVVHISDTGVGMTGEQMDRLFQAFSHADTATARKFGGPGLGLVISRKFIEAMDGTLTVTSEPKHGSTFTVRIPVKPVVSTAAFPGAVLPPAPNEKAPTVLVIDDDPGTRDLMVRFFQKEGFSARTAADGPQGLLLARQLHPVLITLDVMMPEVDGWSVLSALKADPTVAGIPVVMVTVTDEHDKGFTLGAAEFLTKPVDFARLSGLLREYCPVPGDRPILVVEDDEISRHLLRRNLEKEGYPVMLATNGRDALEMIRLRLPSVILLDLLMPEMDGFAFAQAVRERKDMRDVPIVVLTAKDLTDEDKERLNGSVAVILQKQTLTPESLQTELRAALAHHLKLKPKA